MISSRHRARPALAAAALSCQAGLLLGACGSAPAPAAGPATTVTATATTTVTPTPPSPAGPAAAPACPTRSLGVRTGTSEGAAGSVYLAIDFTNISSAPCTLYGFPGVSLAGGQPVRQIGLAASENHATTRQLVTLAPGQVASALLRIVDAHNYPASRCDLAATTYLQVYPPNQTTPVYVAYHSQACRKSVPLLTVDVVKPGPGTA